jgi:hypothetical protein
MPLVFKASAVTAGDCSSIYLFDKTGAYNALSNPGGYGSPNTPIADVTTTVISILYAGATTAVNVSPTAYPALPSSNDEAAYQITPSMIGLSAFPSGITTINYSISGISGSTPFSYTHTQRILVDCEYRCCIDKKNKEMALKIANGNCGCSSDSFMKTLFLSTVLDAAHAAVCCGNETEANQLLSYLKTQCSEGGCGC